MSTNRPDTAAPDGFDVFLSHSGADKDAVLEIARRLRDVGIAPFLDIWHLVPGEPWQEALEEALERSRACAVFLGPAGFGPWENEEMRVALSRRVKDSEYRVIPVLLPGAELPNRGKLPGFLARVTWADFRPGLDDADAFDRLVSGIRGLAPQTAADSGEDATPDDIVCPFRGLEVFDEAHAEFFFGREALTQHLIEQLRADRFLAVLGPSGSGKSSVVRAGLIPALRNGALPGSADWDVLIVRPGPNPMEALATRLVELTGAHGDAVGAQASILDALTRDERGLHTVAQLAADGHSSDDRVVILVDQFEEIFTLVPDEENEQRKQFVAALLYASSVAGGPTVVVATMRADFFGKCAAIPGLAARLSERDVLVAPMDETELRSAMVRPAEKVGLQFEKGLVDTILDDLGDEPGSLPLLQHTLLELFDGRRGRWLTIDRYVAIGRVKGAIASRADSVYDHLTPEEQAAARRILLRLTQPGEGTDDTRRRATLSELVPSGAAGSTIQAVVNELAEARLVTTSRNETGEEVVDVAHEALIRSWPRLQHWVDENPAALRIHRELTNAAETWEANKRQRGYLYGGPRLDEAIAFAQRNNDDLNDLERSYVKASTRARQRRTILLVGGLVAASLIVAVAGLAAFVSGQQARHAAGEAATNALLSDSIAVARDSPAFGQRLAVEALVRGQELGMDLKQLTSNASSMIASGRYASLPRPIDSAWTDQQGQILVGSNNAGGAVFSTRDGSVLAELEKPVSEAVFSRDPSAGVFIVVNGDGRGQLRWIADGAAVEAPAMMGPIALDPEPGMRSMVVSYGPEGDSNFQNELPAEVRSVVDGTVLRELAGPADVQLLGPPSLGLALVMYHDGGVEVIRLSDGGTVTTIPTARRASILPNPAEPSFVIAAEGRCTLVSAEPTRSFDLGPCGTSEDLSESIAFGADGRALTIATELGVELFDADTGGLVIRIDRPFRVNAYSPESPPRFVIAGQASETKSETRLYSAADGKMIAKFPDDLFIEEFGGSIFSADGSLVLLPMGGSTKVVSTSTGQVVLSGVPPIDADAGDAIVPIQGVGFSPDGNWFMGPNERHLEVRRVDAPQRPGPTVPPGAMFWPGSDGALVVSSGGLERIRADGEVDQLLGAGSGRLHVGAFAMGGSNPAVTVTLTSDGQESPRTSVLTADGVLHPLGDAMVSEAFFSEDPHNAFITTSDAAGRTSLWNRADTPLRLANLGPVALTSWDPRVRWLATGSQTGEAYLIDVDWLVAMAASGPSTDVEWLEQQVCDGPARKLVDDAALTQRLGEAPHSCQTR